MVWAKNDDMFRVFDVASRTDTPERPRRGLCAHGGMPQTPTSRYEAGSPRSSPLCADFNVAYLAEALGRAPLSFLRGAQCLDTVSIALSTCVLPSFPMVLPRKGCVWYLCCVACSIVPLVHEPLLDIGVASGRRFLPLFPCSFFCTLAFASPKTESEGLTFLT